MTEPNKRPPQILPSDLGGNLGPVEIAHLSLINSGIAEAVAGEDLRKADEKIAAERATAKEQKGIPKKGLEVDIDVGWHKHKKVTIPGTVALAHLELSDPVFAEKPLLVRDPSKLLELNISEDVLKATIAKGQITIRDLEAMGLIETPRLNEMPRPRPILLRKIIENNALPAEPKQVPLVVRTKGKPVSVGVDNSKGWKELSIILHDAVPKRNKRRANTEKLTPKPEIDIQSYEDRLANGIGKKRR